MVMKPVTKILQFIVAGVTFLTDGQKVKKNTKLRYAHANKLFAIPRTPGMRQGPQESVLPVVFVRLNSLAETLREMIPPVVRR
jgi:hypothetical protein